MHKEEWIWAKKLTNILLLSFPYRYLFFPFSLPRDLWRPRAFFLTFKTSLRGHPKKVFFVGPPPFRPQETSFDILKSPDPLDYRPHWHYGTGWTDPIESVGSARSAPQCQSGSCPALSNHAVCLVRFSFVFQRLWWKYNIYIYYVLLFIIYIYICLLSYILFIIIYIYMFIIIYIIYHHIYIIYYHIYYLLSYILFIIIYIIYYHIYY